MVETYFAFCVTWWLFGIMVILTSKSCFHMLAFGAMMIGDECARDGWSPVAVDRLRMIVMVFTVCYFAVYWPYYGAVLNR
jgi:hypothetical protein